MTDTVTISCILDTTDPAAALGMEIWIDDNRLFDSDHIQKTEQVSLELSDDDGEHELKFVLKNKTEADTKIDEAGNIIKDATLTISDLAFDEIKLGYMISDLAVYAHNFNGTGETIQDKFYGAMGCNGTVSIKFSTPIYLWLLEHM